MEVVLRTEFLRCLERAELSLREAATYRTIVGDMNYVALADALAEVRRLAETAQTNAYRDAFISHIVSPKDAAKVMIKKRPRENLRASGLRGALSQRWNGVAKHPERVSSLIDTIRKLIYENAQVHGPVKEMSDSEAIGIVKGAIEKVAQENHLPVDKLENAFYDFTSGVGRPAYIREKTALQMIVRNFSRQKSHLTVPGLPVIDDSEADLDLESDEPF